MGKNAKRIEKLVSHCSVIRGLLTANSLRGNPIIYFVSACAIRKFLTCKVLSVERHPSAVRIHSTGLNSIIVVKKSQFIIAQFS